jgi:hypothetical protein
MYRLLLWATAFLGLFVACRQSGPTPQHTVISEGLPELRSRFNADAGKIRAIFLAAPT